MFGLLASLVLVTACTDSGGHDGSATTDSVDAAKTIPVVAFDSPSRFDLTQAVEVSPDAAFGTLHETTLLWIEDDGTLRSTDLADPRRSWSTPLPIGPHIYLRPPFVVGNVAVVTTRENSESEAPAFVIGIVGVDIGDGSILWSVSEEINRGIEAWPSMEPCLGAVERDGDVLLTYYPLVDYPSILLDPTDGTVRWKSPAVTIPTMSSGYVRSPPPAVSGRYTVAAYNSRMYSLDLETGQLGPEPLLEGRSRHVDPADPTYIILHPEEWASSQTLLRFSTVDGSVQAFVPDPGDIRYTGEYDCVDQAGPVWVCRGAFPPYSVIGLDPTSGDVRWTADDSYDELVVFHDNVYLRNSIKGAYAVIDRSTGQTINSDIGIDGRPIQVNEYGVFGFGSKAGSPLDHKWAWAPASG